MKKYIPNKGLRSTKVWVEEPTYSKKSISNALQRVYLMKCITCRNIRMRLKLEKI